MAVPTGFYHHVSVSGHVIFLYLFVCFKHGSVQKRGAPPSTSASLVFDSISAAVPDGMDIRDLEAWW